MASSLTGVATLAVLLRVFARSIFLPRELLTSEWPNTDDVTKIIEILVAPLPGCSFERKLTTEQRPIGSLES